MDPENPDLTAQNDEPTAGAAAPDNEPDADDAPGAPMENELCVPVSSLAMPGEDDAMESPAVGDKGQANIEWTVTRIEGDNAYVTVDAVNGNKLEAAEGPPSEDDQMAELKGMAEQMPERY